MSNQARKILRKINKVEVVFFDLDGTITDTEKLYFRFWKEASKYFNHELKDEEVLNLRSLEHNSAIKYFEEITKGGLDYYQTRNKRIELMNEYFLTHEIEVKEGVKSFLEFLKINDKKLYIVSANSVDKSNDILHKTNLIQYFDGVISAKNVKRGKPFPDVFIYASEVVNVPTKDIIVFEDSPNGLLASHEAGCYTVMVEDLSKYNKNMSYVSAHISSFSELEIG